MKESSIQGLAAGALYGVVSGAAFSGGCAFTSSIGVVVVDLRLLMLGEGGGRS